MGIGIPVTKVIHPSSVEALDLQSEVPFTRLRVFRSTGKWLFEENQDLLHMFEKFRQYRTKEEQINSTELAEHANNVMNTLDEGIKGLDDLDNFFAYIHQVGASHRRIPGFKVEYFWKIEAPFLAAVETTLGDRYTPNVENIYKITIKFILETLIEGYEKAGTPGNST
ncbi:Neuroglobin [Papilio machaon]|uniref:Neuroglobin n=1 Tax=Papilio machaon TaxID=76193 RepID=A0A194RMQ1_PAPMA|nr:Neuroglobin [Papilio machaon]